MKLSISRAAFRCKYCMNLVKRGTLEGNISSGSCNSNSGGGGIGGNVVIISVVVVIVLVVASRDCGGGNTKSKRIHRLLERGSISVSWGRRQLNHD
jgi:hypothetical protein